MTTTIAPTTTPSAMATALPEQELPPTRRLFTVDEVLAMDRAGIFHPEERVELLDGEIIVMPPIGDPHADGTDRLDESFKEQLRRRARVRVQGPVRINGPQPVATRHRRSAIARRLSPSDSRLQWTYSCLSKSQIVR